MFHQLIYGYAREADKSKSIFALSSARGAIALSGNLMYGTLPVILGLYYGHEVAGIIISVLNFLTFVILPLAGQLADNIPVIKVIKVNTYTFLLGAILRLFFPEAELMFFLILGLFFIGYGFYVHGVYLLRVADADKGGMSFALMKTMISIGALGATLLLPHFVNDPHPRVPIIIMVSIVVQMIVISMVVPDMPALEKPTRKFIKKSFILDDIKSAREFIQKNEGYPMLFLQVVFFHGIFHAGIWFLFPLMFADQPDLVWYSPLILGIYHLVYILFTGISGYIADHRRIWKTMTVVGWTIIIVGAGSLFFFQSIEALILLGALIGIGDTMVFAGSSHALRKHDNSHDKDGSFIAFQRMVVNIGYILMPLLLGFAVAYNRHFGGLSIILGATIIIGFRGIKTVRNLRK